MAYNKNTDWDNESKYLNNLIQNGNAGEKAWASNQMNALNAAQAQYGGTSSNNTSSYTPTTNTSGSSGGNSQYKYTIGSDAGKQIAQNLAINSPYTASDGSVWTKQNDGSISVNHNGVITNNAYTPSDYTLVLKQQVEAGVPWQIVQSTLDARDVKIYNDPSLEQYRNHPYALQAWAYIQDQKNKQNQEENQQFSMDQMLAFMSQFMQQNPQPTQPQKDPRIDQILNEILTRDDFSYNASNDPLFQQYSQIYQREGDRAMRETLAEAAASAGGMNTYAITAAQQAANYYNSQLTDRIPELYQLAYEMYLKDKESQIQDLGILQDMDATQYNRYRDTMNDWQNDRSFAYGTYQDAINQGNWQTRFDYNSSVNNRDFLYSDYWNNKEWNSNQSETEKSDAQAEIKLIIAAGGTTVPSELVEKSGWSQATIDALIADEQNRRAEANATSNNMGDDNNDGYTPKDPDPDPEFTLKGVLDLGLNMPAPSEEYILTLAEAGLVTIDSNGNVKWADGVNAENYKSRLKTWQSILPPAVANTMNNMYSYVK